MDYHFTLPQDEPVSHSKSSTGLSRLMKRLAPVFILSAILPLFLIVVLSPTDLKFLTRADSDAQLRVWLEPAQIITSPGKTITVKVFAQFESDSQLMPGVTLTPESDSLLVRGEISYLKPFNGQVELGEIEIESENSGVFDIVIPIDSVNTPYTNPLEIITSPARVHVR